MIHHLFEKLSSGQAVKEVKQRYLSATEKHDFHPWRQCLLLPQHTLDQHQLQPGQLKEDVVVGHLLDIDLHQLPSGSCLQLGEAIVRLTFHCDPCYKLQPFISPKRLKNQRGYHSQIVQSGMIRQGDKVTLSPQKYDAIPHRLADRIQWYLQRHPEPILVQTLLARIGFSHRYCRAVPNAIRRRNDINAELILYKSRLSHSVT